MTADHHHDEYDPEAGFHTSCVTDQGRRAQDAPGPPEVRHDGRVGHHVAHGRRRQDRHRGEGIDRRAHLRPDQVGRSAHLDPVVAQDDQHVGFGTVLHDDRSVGAGPDIDAGHPHVAIRDPGHERRRQRRPQHRSDGQVATELLEHDSGLDQTEGRVVASDEHAEHAELGQGGPAGPIGRHAFAVRHPGQIEPIDAQRTDGVLHRQLIAVQPEVHRCCPLSPSTTGRNI